MHRFPEISILRDKTIENNECLRVYISLLKHAVELWESQIVAIKKKFGPSLPINILQMTMIPVGLTQWSRPIFKLFIIDTTYYQAMTSYDYIIHPCYKINSAKSSEPSD